MHVIEKGRPQKGWAKEVICTGKGNGDGGCNAKLLVEEADVYITCSSARDEDTYYTTIRCPECGVETDIKDVPGKVESKAPDKSKWFKMNNISEK
jgi:DNA-directed RNA polymerase subunit RPC12/RpoP